MHRASKIAISLIARNEDTYSRDGDFVNDAAMCRSIDLGEGEVVADA